MTTYYEEVEIEDMTFDESTQQYTYPCPCGDQFQVSLEELHDGEDEAPCPSCTLVIKVIYEEEDLPPLPMEDEEDDEDDGEDSIEETAAKVNMQSSAPSSSTAPSSSAPLSTTTLPLAPSPAQTA
eukprot:CAMPEP_0197557622 /NCGR_PEP_ID=MMETSP1320-20131121/17478_1 /TAXON_ID=91990 /ORGANISM="Bolidomonas sp., Strain RCC2347" /LENGTH=124 /DNA_ID=CAMNT_0043118873 /DNA_START=143 /DNA_END=513 /DNA_ORIENTATION=-